MNSEVSVKKVPRGSYLTPERLLKIKIGFLSVAERQVFVDILLFEYEGAIAFNDSEMGLLNSDIKPPVIVQSVPHTPWRQQLS